jgi:hypothetical protein
MKDSDASRSERASKMAEVAQKLCDQQGLIAQREGILQVPDLVSVFAAACAMSIVKMKDLDEGFASELVGVALRTIIKNVVMYGVEVPDL